MRKAQISRKTTETDIRLELSLDGAGSYRVKSGSGFFDHMLEQLARHARFDLTLDCEGDTEVDMHHSVEDTGICLGEAVAKALGDKKGIRRYGHIVLPMDEALILCAIDLSGRSLFHRLFRHGFFDSFLFLLLLYRLLFRLVWHDFLFIVVWGWGTAGAALATSFGFFCS